MKIEVDLLALNCMFDQVVVKAKRQYFFECFFLTVTAPVIVFS